jgi:hypothetical protein
LRDGEARYLLDGRNRLDALELNGVPILNATGELLIEHRECPENVNPIDYVVSANLARRYMTQAQKAMIAAKLATMTRTDAVRFGLAGFGARTSRRLVAAANRPLTQAEAAAKMGINPRSVARAKQILRDGDAGTIAAVQSGKLGLTAAVEIVALPAAARQEAVDRIATAGSAMRADRMRRRGTREKTRKTAPVRKGSRPDQTEAADSRFYQAIDIIATAGTVTDTQMARHFGVSEAYVAKVILLRLRSIP